MKSADMKYIKDNEVEQRKERTVKTICKSCKA